MWLKNGICLESMENIMVKEESSGDQYFLLFLQCVQKAFFSSPEHSAQTKLLW